LIAGVAVFLLLVGGGVFVVMTRQKTEPPVSTEPKDKQPTNVTIENAKPDNMTQQTSDGTTIETGQWSSSNGLTFEWDLPEGATNNAWTPEIEIQPKGTDFKGEPSQTASAEIKDGSAVVTVTGLEDAEYHWQARFAEGTNFGPWVSYGENDEASGDFAIDTVAPSAPTISDVDGNAPSGGSVSISSNKPVITGKTGEPGDKVTIQVQSTGGTLTAQSDAQGNWSVTPDSDLPNGNIVLSITGTDLAGNTSSPSSQTLAINSAPTAPAVSGGLAKTGDNTLPLNMLGVIMMLGSLVTLGILRRHESKL
jgi:hypothetical protein